MSSPSISPLNLSSLPSDIIRLITGMNLESAPTIRMISPRWNALVLEVLNNRKVLPVLNYFRWTTNVTQCNPSVTIDPRYAEYFGVSRWDQFDETFDKNKRVKFSNGFSRFGRIPVLKTRLTRLFKRCSSVAMLSIEAAQLPFLKNSMGDAPVHDLIILNICEFDKTFGACMLDFVYAHSVRSLSLAFNGITSSEWTKTKLVLVRFFKALVRSCISVCLCIGNSEDESEMNSFDLQNHWYSRIRSVIGNKFYIRISPLNVGIIIKIDTR
ncbi:hypothetical protein PRIPAC_76651 [Pristionchus pacificus]|uniref:Uncharacterized protein n=1 Tax=Pristionchus pacificus TaxID=54126 RepID=A0A2A6C0U0_PRIPA|nr:hypothetical protein PRIPAC_76651 [Pristionchus pacificus]|eukprot:PDM71633.1 hypothetical protein PRIPAC_38040 [Pristionchus pacificus]